MEELATFLVAFRDVVYSVTYCFVGLTIVGACVRLTDHLFTEYKSHDNTPHA